MQQQRKQPSSSLAEAQAVQHKGKQHCRRGMLVLVYVSLNSVAAAQASLHALLF